MKSKTLILVSIFFCFLFAAFLTCLISGFNTVSGRDIYVDTSPYYLFRDGTAEHPYKTIQSAIDLADEGDTVYVFGGTYNESLNVYKKINLSGGIDDKNTTISYGTDCKYLITIAADYVMFEGFDVVDNGNHIISEIGGALIHVTADNVILQRNTIKNCTNGWGIYLDSCNGNVIGANLISNIKSGIYLSNSHTDDIINNQILNCVDAAVDMRNSQSNRIYDNILSGCRYGIYARDCSSSNISKNVIESNTLYGIGLYKSNNDIISENTINKNSVDGIYLNSYLSVVRNNTISGNQIGVVLDESSNEIYQNTIISSGSIGLSALSGSQNNRVYKNSFSGNVINAKEQGSNQWDYGGYGNYWDDYKQVDRNFDGIGDVSYQISGRGTDHFPLGVFLKPPNKPATPSPADDAENVGLKVTLQVDVSDPNGWMMKVSFYNAADDTLLGIRQNVINSVISYDISLSFGTTFAWYVKVNNSLLENRSDIWFFTIKQRPPQNKKPIANTGGPYTGKIGQEISLSGSGSSDPDGSISFYRWNFGDGSSEILQMNPTHTYSAPGVYVVTLTVIDNEGTSGMVNTTVTILSTPLTNQLPQANAGGSYSGLVGNILTFSAAASTDSDGSIVNYTWTFQDKIQYGQSTIHTFVNPGTYLVTLTVTDDKGGTNQTSALVTISPVSSKGVPGFELGIVLIAIGAIILLEWKQKR